MKRRRRVKKTKTPNAKANNASVESLMEETKAELEGLTAEELVIIDEFIREDHLLQYELTEDQYEDYLKYQAEHLPQLWLQH